MSEQFAVGMHVADLLVLVNGLEDAPWRLTWFVCPVTCRAQVYHLVTRVFRLAVNAFEVKFIRHVFPFLMRYELS